MRTSERDCHDGKRMLDLKFAQAEGSMGRFKGVGVVEREVVEVGLKGVREGAIRALRFWIMLSSMVARERRRKSGRWDQ